MTKAEQKRMAELEHELACAKALHFPTYPTPKPMSKADIESSLVEGGIQYGSTEMVARGYFENSHSIRVTYGCSRGSFHAIEGDTTTTQNMGVMYRTEVEAWRVIRHKKTREFAETLAKIDAEIARCEAETPA